MKKFISSVHKNMGHYRNRFAYMTKGLTINYGHLGNFKDGKLIDIPSLDTRDKYKIFHLH